MGCIDPSVFCCGFVPRMTTVWEEEPEEGAVFCPNHGGLGPLEMCVHFPLGRSCALG